MGMDASGQQPQFLAHPDGSKVAYVHTPGEQPGIFFCGGFNSDMQGSKALALEKACVAAGRQFTRFDYRGHGTSSGMLEDHNISDWRADAQLLLEAISTGPLVIVGSSMGMWVACLLIKANPERFIGCVGIAGAPDFTEELLLPKLGEPDRQQLAAGKLIRMPTEYDDQGYPIALQFIEDGRNNRVLLEPLDVSFPVRLLHGTLDDSVPWQHSVRIMEMLQGDDIRLTLIKGGDHRLSDPDSLQEIIQQTFSLLG